MQHNASSHLIWICLVLSMASLPLFSTSQCHSADDQISQVEPARRIYLFSSLQNPLDSICFTRRNSCYQPSQLQFWYVYCTTVHPAKPESTPLTFKNVTCCHRYCYISFLNELRNERVEHWAAGSTMTSQGLAVLTTYLCCHQGLKKPGFFLKKPNPAGFLGFNGFYWAMDFFGFFSMDKWVAPSRDSLDRMHLTLLTALLVVSFVV